MQIKLNCYTSDGTQKWEILKVKNSDSLRFSESINGWQGWLDIELWESFDNADYNSWDFVEYIIYNDEYKNGLHKYTWYITGIERKLSIKKWSSIILKVAWLKTLLEQYEIHKTYTWTLSSVIDELITDFHSKKNITNEIQFLWTNILKNTISNTDNINASVSGNFFEALKNIFWENRDFFIDKSGSIHLVSENTKKHTLTLNSNISEIEINENSETQIELSHYSYNIEAGQKIQLQNVSSFLNLDNQIIQKIDFNLLSPILYLWETLSFKSIVS